MAMKKKPARGGKSQTAKKKLKDLEPKNARKVRGGKASISDFRITKKVDKSSPVLF
jgi:type VI protein secretion system component Hcp